MKVAFCTKEMQQIETARNIFSELRSGEMAAETDFFCSQENMLKRLGEKFYDIVIIFINGESRAEDDWIRQIRKIRRDGICGVVYGNQRPAVSDACTRYTAQFNGQKHVFNIQDICYFETYNRKTSVNVGEHKIRITARLDEEAEKLSSCHFALVNRWSLVNMLHVRDVAEDEVYMSNGDVLYISGSKRKEFLDRYQEYVNENFRVI